MDNHNTLTTEEQQELIFHERVIEQGKRVFMEVGNALLVIRDKKLYRTQYDTFADYCERRWAFKRKYAYYLMDAAGIATEIKMSTTVDIPNERTARQLKQYDEDLRPAIVETAQARANAEGRILTSADIAAAGQALIQTKEGKPHVAYNSGENEWYTPRPIIEAAAQLMGGIDLDPASSDIANTLVQATTYYTVDTDGLRQSWHGNVWLNPPYAQPLIAQFCEKLQAERALGHIQQACVLVNNATETAWFQGLLDGIAGLCLIKGRVKFLDIDLKANGAPLQGQALLYYGTNRNAFHALFAPFGALLYA